MKIIDENVLLTISVAAYNVEKYIQRAIDSIIGCDCRNYIEMLIIDDGSKDNTSKIAREYSDRYSFIKLVSKENGGYGSTINKALSLASGKYFKLLDGDDKFVTQNLFSYLTYLKKCESDLVISPYILYKEKLNEKTLVDRHNLDVDTKELDSCNLLDIHMHELAVKTVILKKHSVQITEKCFYTDCEFVFKSLLFANTISKFNLPIYEYRIGIEGQSVSLSGRINHYKDSDLVVREMLSQLAKYETRNVLQKSVHKCLEEMIITSSVFQYMNYLLIECNSQHKEELIDFDCYIRKMSKTIYKSVGKRSKVIRLMRLLHFNFLFIFHKRCMKG